MGIKREKLAYKSCGIKMPAAEETVSAEVKSDDDQGEDEPEGVALLTKELRNVWHGPGNLNW